MSTVLILGAGATAGAKGLPTDRDFFSRYGSVVNSFDFLTVALDYLHRRSWIKCRLENVWSEIDALFNSPPRLPPGLENRVLALFKRKAAEENSLPKKSPRYYQVYWEERCSTPKKRSLSCYLFLFAGWELRQAICSVYGQVVSGGETKYRELVEEYATYRPVSVVDFNYDLYFEEAFDKRRWFYYPESPLEIDAIEILKPHGSLNWIHRNVGEADEEIVVNSAGVYPLSSWGYQPRLAQTSIIPMVRAKREFTTDEESETIRSRYSRILYRCKEVIRCAQHICIVGYSFPPGDRHFQKVLRDVQRTRPGPPVSLKYIGRDGTVRQWSERLRRLFGVTVKPEVRLNGF